MKNQKTRTLRDVRKEIHFSKEEFNQIRHKAFEASLPMAVYIREASLGNNLKAAMTQEEKEQYQRSINLSSRYLNNLNQLMRISHTFGTDHPKLQNAIVEFVKRADKYLQGENYDPIDTLSLEQSLKVEEREKSIMSELNHQSGSLVANLQAELESSKQQLESYRQLLSRSAKYYFFSSEGENVFKEKYDTRLYANESHDRWFLKVGDHPAYELPCQLSNAWLRKEISIADIYEHWKGTI